MSEDLRKAVKDLLENSWRPQSGEEFFKVSRKYVDALAAAFSGGPSNKVSSEPDIELCETTHCYRTAVRTHGGYRQCIPCMPPMYVTAYEVAMALIDSDAKCHETVIGPRYYYIRWFGKLYVDDDTATLRQKLQVDVAKGGSYRNPTKGRP